MGLTHRHQRFVDEYLIDLNGTEAAIRAGYSAKSAKAQAHQLLSRPDVQAAVSDAQASRSERTKVTADTVLQHLDAARTADLADLYDDDGNLRPIKDWPLIWRQGLVAGVEVEELFDGRGEDREHIGRVRKVKMADRTRILELVGKHVRVQAFNEKVEVTGAGGGPVQSITTVMTPQQAAEAYAATINGSG